MPTIVQGAPTGGSFSKKDLGYDYPEGLDLRPGSQLHERIKKEILDRARVSANIIKGRFASWNEIDRVLTAYIDLSESEKRVKGGDSRKPVSIVFPYSYAILESLLSYLMTAFLQDPIFNYEGVSPEDTLGAILLEKIVEQHCQRFKVGLSLHTWFRDSLAYGMGIVTPTWRQQTGMDMRTGEDSVLFEGNALENIDPYLFLPDPNVSLHKIQDGEFIGWVSPDNYLNLLSAEKRGLDTFEVFNVRYLADMKNRKTTIYSGDSSDRYKKTLKTNPRQQSESVTNQVDLIYMYINLIPSEWGLSDSTYPEKWFFALAGDEVVVRAKPLGLSHNMYPVCVIAPDFDGYSITPQSRIEVLYGLQGVLDWLFNSHIANVRKVLNDMFIVDPYLVNINDLKDPKEGRIIKLRRPAWGKGVANAIQQLPVRDVTSQHVNDSAFIVNWMQKIAGADNPMMGSLRMGGPERLSSAEYQGTSQGAMSRLERVAKVIGLQGMQDLGFMFAYHTQQLISQETYVKATGEWETTLRQEFGISQGSPMRVSPRDLLVNFDLKVRDGSVPGGNFSSSWLQLFETIARDPDLRARFDIGRIFTHIARNLGAKNVEQFTIQPEVRSEEAIAQDVQAGNLVPVGEM